MGFGWILIVVLVVAAGVFLFRQAAETAQPTGANRRATSCTSAMRAAKSALTSTRRGSATWRSEPRPAQPNSIAKGVDT